MRDLPWDDAEMQSSVFTGKMVLCCSRPIMLEAMKDPCACYNACQWEFGFSAELLSSAPVLCYSLTALKINVLHLHTRHLPSVTEIRSLLSVQLVLDSESCFHSPSEDHRMLTQCLYLTVGLELIIFPLFLLSL